jgi:hypothetical protein
MKSVNNCYYYTVYSNTNTINLQLQTKDLGKELHEHIHFPNHFHDLLK